MERTPGAGVVHGNRWHFAAEAGSSRAPLFAAGSSLPERRLSQWLHPLSTVPCGVKKSAGFTGRF